MGFFFGFASPSTDLLAGETDGLAVNFADTSDFALSTWGMQAVQERNSSVDTLQSPHVFFTNSGTSPKYVKNSAATIGWSPHNLIAASEVFTNGVSNWQIFGMTLTANSTTAPDGTSTADTLTINAGLSARYAFSYSTATIANAIYTASVYVKKKTYNFVSVSFSSNATNTNWIKATFDLDNPTVATQNQAGAGGTLLSSGITSIGNGWYRIWVAGSITTTDGAFQFQIDASGTPATAVYGEPSWTGAGTEEVYVWGAQYNRGIIPTAYVKTTGTAGVCGLPISYGEGLLVEPAATNICLNSQTFDDAGGTDAWVLQGTATSVSANTTTAPDGSTTADTIIEGSGTNNFGVGHMSTASITVSNAVYTASVYAKTKENNWLEILIGSNDSFTKYVGAAFNLNAGTAGTIRNVTYTGTSTITAVGNGWYRCTLTTSALDANSTTGMYLETSDGDNFAALHVGDSASGTYVWGAQLELGTVATSYVPTVSATATRAADKIDVALSAFGFSTTEGTVYVQATSFAATGAGFWNIRTSSEAFSDSMYGWINGGVVEYDAYNSGGTIQALLNDETHTAGVEDQVTTAWKVNDYAQSVNGSVIETDTSGTVPASMTTLRLGLTWADSQGLNGHIARLVYVPRRVIDGDLPTWRYNF